MPTSISNRRNLIQATQIQSNPLNRKAYKNVLLLISDDHSFEMGCWGNSVVHTPNLDFLAGDGIRFTNTFCTTASCSASRSVIYTGLHNHANGQYGHAHDYNHFSLHSWVQPIPQLLKQDGYKTGIIGKFHVNPANQFQWDYSPSVNSRNVVKMSEKADEFFTSFKDDPFMLVVGFSDPHRAGKGFGEDKIFPGVDKRSYNPSDVIVPPFLPDNEDVRMELTKYYSAISRMDQGIGLILKALDKAGKTNDTLVLYISDNGMAFPGAKTTVYDPGIHLPMIIRSPIQQKRGTVNHAMVSFTDLVPTILDWTGTAPPEYELHGRSFLPVLENENPKGWDEIYFSHTFHEITMYYPSRGIRTRKYKYINNLASDLTYPFASDLYASPTWQGILRRGDTHLGARDVYSYLHHPEEELYDLTKDPNEINNLAYTHDYRSALETLRKKTNDFRERTNDPWLKGRPGMEPHTIW